LHAAAVLLRLTVTVLLLAERVAAGDEDAAAEAVALAGLLARDREEAWMS
jgi:hypothetical protein